MKKYNKKNRINGIITIISMIITIITISAFFFYFISPIIFIKYNTSAEVKSYLEEKYTGSFEYVSKKNFNNGINGEGFLKGKEYIFKDEDGILFSGYSLTSNNSPDILSAGKDTRIYDNYIQKCAYAMYIPPIDTITIDDQASYFYYRIKIRSMDQNTLEDASELAACIFLMAREKLKAPSSLASMTVIITYSYEYKYVINFNELPEKVQQANTINELKNDLIAYLSQSSLN